MKKKRIHIIVSGLVQGVFFRASTLDKARNLIVVGWVRNLPDGTVEINAEGEDGKLSQLLDWARKGPVGARVDHIDYFWDDYRGEFESFFVR